MKPRGTPGPEPRAGRAVWAGTLTYWFLDAGLLNKHGQRVGTEVAGVKVQEKERIEVGMVDSGGCGRPEAPGNYGT